MTEKYRRRAAFLQEMGVGTIWVRRHAGPAVDLAAIPAAESHAGASDCPVSMPDAVDAAAPPAVVAAARPDAIATAPASAAATGAQAAWDEVPLAVEPATPESASEIALMDWPQLQAAVAACRGCDLCQRRNQTVFGSGDRQAKWLFVGEGPGQAEDRQGQPFVGPAGKLLENMLSAMGLQRDVNVYLTNVVKCRSTDAQGADHAPSPQQIAACRPYLERQIALLQPTVIVALGKTAALALLGCAPDATLASLRGRLHAVQQRPIVVTYHPAHLLRNPIAKREAWDDLCLALRTFTEHTLE